jgi:hypothetical protein
VPQLQHVTLEQTPSQAEPSMVTATASLASANVTSSSPRRYSCSSHRFFRQGAKHPAFVLHFLCPTW